MKKWFRKFEVKGVGVHRGEAGGVAVYSAFFIVFALGVGALALDVGRMTVLRSQMQDRADAGAMAAAVQLDGRVGAQARATAVAMNAMSQTSGISSDGQDLNVQTVNFYSEYGATTVAATGDVDSRFVEVILEPRRVDFLLEPVVNPSGGQHYKNLAARAVAGANPFICQAPPLMLCDPGEADPTKSLALVGNIGKQVVLKPPPKGGTWAPGNYGLLGLPDGSRDMVVEKATLLESGFDELNGVDWDKGCYMGQELTARTKYRGLTKKRLMPVDIDGPVPPSGTPVMVDGKEAGEMRSARGGVGLALIRLEHLDKAAGARFTAGEARITPRKPDWAAF